MRILSMHKATAEMEAGAPPSAKIVEGMGPLMGEMASKGVFVSGEGLRPSAHGVRVRFAGGERTITPGPLSGDDLMDRFLIVRTRDIDEAIAWAERFAGGEDADLHVRPVCEPWDLGFMPRPEGLATTRYMILHKGDGGARPQLREEGLPGELVMSEALRPSASAKRLRFRGGERTVLDGPFAESKELVAGFSIMEVGSVDEAVEWAGKFAALFEEIEIDVRPLAT